MADFGFGREPFGHFPWGHSSGAAATKIQDIVRNPMAASDTGEMVGWVEPPADAEALQLDMYRFLINGIRIEDRRQ